MFWESCQIEFFTSGSKEFVKMSGKEVLNKHPFWVYISKESFLELQSGIPLNIALKWDSLEKREFLISGLAPLQLAPFVFEREPIRTVFITNSVASSVAFYAMAYLNNKGLSPMEIRSLRVRYSFKNFEQSRFNLDELRQSFLTQSAFFLNLYKEMNENDRFEHFADNLVQQNRFIEVFGKYQDIVSLKGRYARRIFHDKLECEYMRSHYHEEVFHQNTGVFSENQLMIKQQDYYSVNKGYLEELKMRICKICENG